MCLCLYLGLCWIWTSNDLQYPNRLTDVFEGHGMTVVKSPVIQLATVEHEVELQEIRMKEPQPELMWQEDVSCKLLLIVQPILLFCNCLRIILMFFNSVKICEVKKCKIDKHVELGLYRQPNINFQGPKSKGTSRGMHVKILICSKCSKNSTWTTASSGMSSIFQENFAFFQPPNFLLSRKNFQLSTFNGLI